MKEVRVSFRVSHQEHDEIISAVEQHYNDVDGKVSEYIRQKVLHSDLPIGIDKDIRDLKYQIQKVGTNINQIAKKFNAGFGYETDANDAVEEIRKIEIAFEKLLEIVEEKKHGHY